MAEVVASLPHPPALEAGPGPRAEPLQAIAGFAAMLRDHGLKVGVPEQQAFVQVALALPLERAAAHLGPAWRAIACRNLRDWRRWPELFERYWHPQVKGSVCTGGRTRPTRDMRQLVQALHETLGDSAPRHPGARALDTGGD
jgi:uncharacterized protein with von Willebrand factor type A (vWA) domain